LEGGDVRRIVARVSHHDLEPVLSANGPLTGEDLTGDVVVGVADATEAAAGAGPVGTGLDCLPELEGGARAEGLIDDLGAEDGGDPSLAIDGEEGLVVLTPGDFAGGVVVGATLAEVAVASVVGGKEELFDTADVALDLRGVRSVRGGRILGDNELRASRPARRDP